MKRKTFLKLSLYSTTALAILPQFGLQTSHLSDAELIGKGNPSLYGNGFLLRKEAFDAFMDMRQAALKDNISIQVVSSYRNFTHQNRIWERKYKSYLQRGLSPEATIQKIIAYSTIPGTSRHHWGTDMDIIDANVPPPEQVLNPKHFEGSGSFTNLKKWMDEHSKTYGFYLPYTAAPDRKGFKYEPWHYSYKPLSSGYLKSYKNLALIDILQQEMLLGHEHFTSFFLESYRKEHILDINPALL